MVSNFETPPLPSTPTCYPAGISSFILLDSSGPSGRNSPPVIQMCHTILHWTYLGEVVDNRGNSFPV